MAEILVLDKGFGNGFNYNLSVISGYGFTPATEVVITITHNGVEFPTIHDTITTDSNGCFYNVDVRLPQLLERGTAKIKATPVIGTLVEIDYLVQLCNISTPEQIGTKLMFNLKGNNKTTYFDDNTVPSTKEVEREIANVEALFYNHTYEPIYNMNIKKKYPTDGFVYLSTGISPILFVNSAQWYNGDWEDLTSYQKGKATGIDFWWDEDGDINFENIRPRPSNEGFYLDMIVGPEVPVPGDIIEAVESKVCSILLNTKDYVETIREGTETIEIYERISEFAKVWNAEISKTQYGRNVYPGY